MLKIKPYQKRKNNSANGNPASSQDYLKLVLKIRPNLNIHTGSPSSCESANSLHILNTAQIKPGFQYKANKVSGLKVFPVGKCYLHKNEPVKGRPNESRPR
ncbi:MAG: hypothetical protein WCK35_01115 [Chloroflexota bacterium]